MLARISTIAPFAMILLLAAATACCESTEESSTINDGFLLSLIAVLGITANLTGQVGATCSPISVISVDGNSCAAKPVCCSNNSFEGLVALDCTPVDLNL
ncbi:fungal hydrophobin-domain-containing protein [Infundibulicybe gibba]|nr:fungal hydrophobin-domain-containing protein [Infundibulicybe gibba]